MVPKVKCGILLRAKNNIPACNLVGVNLAQQQHRIVNLEHDKMSRLENQDTPTDFSINTSDEASTEKLWIRVCLSKTILIFHGSLFAFILLRYGLTEIPSTHNNPSLS